MEHFSIRPVTDSDLPRIKEISEISWRGQGGDWLAEQTFGRLGGKPWFDWFWPNIRTKCQQHPDWVYVSQVQEQLVGFVSLSLNPQTHTGSIGYNALDPSFRGRGYGRQQIEFILDRFRREHVDYVNVIVALNDGHGAAKAIYEKVGCETTAIIETRLARLADRPAPELDDDIAVRPGTLDDRSRLRDLVTTCLRGVHHFSVLEERYGATDPRSWQDRVFGEWEQGLGAGPMAVLLCEHNTTLTGALLCAEDAERRKGIVRHCLVHPHCRETQADIAMLQAVSTGFADHGMELLQVHGFVQDDRSSISAQAVAAFGLDTLVMRSAHKSMRLAY